MKSKSILLVCSGPSYAVESRLRAVGCAVTRVADGRSAVSSTRRYAFDAAVLVSTGIEMDVTETALNLRDVSPLMPIFIIAHRTVSRRKSSSTRHVAELIPKTLTLPIKELTNYLADPVAPSTPLKGSVRTTPN
jgi:DNA-binding response OmpR family regulator